MEALLRDFAFIVTPQERVSLIKVDHADNRVLACAREGKANFIASGDKKHLLPLFKYNEIPIVTVTDFLDYYYEQERSEK